MMVHGNAHMERIADHAQPDDPESACTNESVSNPPKIIIEPSWNDWERAIHDWESSKTEQRTAARADFGLDDSRPVIMSGHQPMIFHGGIVAKLIALHEAAQRTNAQPIWIVPDQDTYDPSVLKVPIGQRETLREELIELYEPDDRIKGIPTGSIPSIKVNDHVLNHSNLDELVELARWLDQFQIMDSLAQQFAHSVIEYTCARLGIEPPTLIFASQLMDSDTIRAFVQSMIDDPIRAVRSYNDSINRFPSAGVRTLEIDDDRIELPLWGMGDGQPRVSIDMNNIHDFESSELVPRGLLMSGIARLYLSDLFIHGIGGYQYDRITEAWFSDWCDQKISMMTKVSADLYLDLGYSNNEIPNLARAQWEHHHAFHTPAMLGDDALQSKKDELVGMIAHAQPGSDQRERLYQSLVQLLRSYREQYTHQLDGYQAQVDRAIRYQSQILISKDRTWPIVSMNQVELDALDRATRNEMR